MGTGKQKETVLGLSAKQIKAAQMLANPEFKGNKTKLCEEVGVTRKTFYEWVQKAEFINYVNELIAAYTDGEIGGVWKALINRCLLGDVQAIKLYFELKGKYKQQVEHSGVGDFVFNILPASEMSDSE